MNASDIIARLGGKAPVSKATGAPMNTVVYWERRQRIPAKHWSHILDLAAEMGVSDITAETLLRHGHRQPPASTAEAAA